jgi:hypothetical protein
MADVIAVRALTRAMELRDREPARDTNALDEVPDSTWFTNRIGVRLVAPEEAAIGPAVDGPPEPPLAIVGGKHGGGNPGFVVRDARGERFIVKFDTKDNPEMQTATSVVVNRIFWTLGYNVPRDTVFTFAYDDLRIEEGATFEDELGADVAIDDRWVREVLARSPRLANGRWRASASQLLDGVPLGGWAMEGVRSDDPNDTIPHEHRRVVRALRVFSAWTGHTDMKEDNTLDLWVADGDRHYVVHYLLDFGEALGAHQAEKGRLDDGWQHVIDWELDGAALLTFGLWARPWEAQRPTRWPVIGAFSAEHFDPDTWREAYPYWPFHEADAADLYWGAKLVVRFEREVLEAIVGAAAITDPGAAAYLVDALWGRRQRIGEAWLEAVSPLDHFRAETGRICMVDVAVRAGIAVDGIVERLPDDYRPEFDDGVPDVERLRAGVREHRLQPDGTVCIPVAGDEGYTIARLRVRRGPEWRPIMQLHYVGGDAPRILGVVRVE